MVNISIIIGSTSDEELGERAAKILDDFNVTYDLKVISAHRNPDVLENRIRTSKAKVFVAIAGLSAHLPGFIASRTKKPVIGVPLSGKLGGMDALLSIVQMPRGVPVACVGIDNGENAAILAARILALQDSAIGEKIGTK